MPKPIDHLSTRSTLTTRVHCRPLFPSPPVSSVIRVVVCMKPEARTCRQAGRFEPPWWESQQEVRSGSLWPLGSELSGNFPHKSSRPPRLPRSSLPSDSAPLLTDCTLRARPLWCGTPHCHCCLTLDPLITSLLLRPGAITAVWSGLENVFWTTNQVLPTRFPFPSKLAE